MAVFGVPFVSPDDSTHACNAALRMRDSLAILNETREKSGLRKIQIGIGINTGMVRLSVFYSSISLYIHIRRYELPFTIFLLLLP